MRYPTLCKTGLAGAGYLTPCLKIGASAARQAGGKHRGEPVCNVGIGLPIVHAVRGGQPGCARADAGVTAVRTVPGLSLFCAQTVSVDLRHAQQRRKIVLLHAGAVSENGK